MDDAPDLPRAVLRQRIYAACWLNGIGMRQLREELGALKAPKLLAEDMIKGDKPQDRRNRRDLSEALHVPMRWFTEPDWRKLIVSERDEAAPRSVDEQGRAALEEIPPRGGGGGQPQRREGTAADA
jgi:hypothetical protein